jgi:hypothetical protein
VAFGTFGEVMAVVFRDGRLVQFDTAGTHLLASNAIAAAVAFAPGALDIALHRPPSLEALDVIFSDHSLWQFDATGGHPLGTV